MVDSVHVGDCKRGSVYQQALASCFGVARTAHRHQHFGLVCELHCRPSVPASCLAYLQIRVIGIKTAGVTCSGGCDAGVTALHS